MFPSESERDLKRKKPPTFQHHPAERAKKLKQSWVETQKIKSKWKAQKRKEGLVASRRQLEHAVTEDKHKTGEADEDQDRTSMSAACEESEERSDDEVPSRKAAASLKSKQPQKSGVQKQTDEQPSLRDLQRAAYSRSSLHLHKSDHPLHRRGSIVASRGKGGSGGGGEQRVRGRGQPDMGLRMKAMLEKIKQDHT